MVSDGTWVRVLPPLSEVSCQVALDYPHAVLKTLCHHESNSKDDRMIDGTLLKLFLLPERAGDEQQTIPRKPTGAVG